MRTGSRKLALLIVVFAFILTSYAIHEKMEGVAIAIGTAWVGGGVALYTNKQYQERKRAEIESEKQ